MMDNDQSILVPDWPVPGNVIAFTTTRKGGVSSKPYDSFNLGLHVGDDPRKVRQNRKLLKARFALPDEPAWLEQTHSTRVASIVRQGARLQPADGAVTAAEGVVCAVMTADCMPLFLSNRAGTKVGLLHVGWRGLAQGIIEQGVGVFDQPADRIVAWAGPTISAECFEIGSEVRDQLGGPDQAYSASANSGKCFVDMYLLAGERLRALGVTQYGHSERCTFADKALFSYRRDRITGRMVSLIYRSRS